MSAFEQEVNQLRTHQGQSDVFVINEKRDDPRADLRRRGEQPRDRGAEAAIISSDFGGNPPYEKMKAVASICYRHFLKQTNVLFIIGGKSNNTDILETFRGMGDALGSISRRTGRRRSTSSSGAAGRTWCAAWGTSPRRWRASGCRTGSSASTARSRRW